MGADGNIDILDYEKIEQHFGKEKTKHLLMNTINTYIHEIFGHKVMTGYFGDNVFDSWCSDIRDNKELKDMLDWIEENAVVDTWEVWT